MTRCVHAVLIVSALAACGGAPVEPAAPTRDPGASIEVLEARLARVIGALEANAPEAAAWDRGRARTCRSRAAVPGGADGFAAPAECDPVRDELDTREALRTVVLGLARDLAPLLARVRRIIQRRSGTGYDSLWQDVFGRQHASTVAYAEWLVNRLDLAAWQFERDDPPVAIGRDYEVALLGAQVFALWTQWFEVSLRLFFGTNLRVEWILLRTAEGWRAMEPTLKQLASGDPARIRYAAHVLTYKLPEWGDAFHAWVEEAGNEVREAEQVVRVALLVQAAFDLASMRYLAAPLAAGRVRSFAFVLPGIGGVTASGAAVGVQVVIRAEWAAAVRHLIAVGAISLVEVAKIAGISAAATPGPPLAPAPVAPRLDGSPGAAPSSGAARPVRVVVQHRAGNRQVDVDGQRWHVPRGRSPADIPRADPVGDRLQAAVDRIAARWSPSQLTARERLAIDRARDAGEPWRARLLERQARGRWVEAEVESEFRHFLRWKRRGVDAIDLQTGIRYEILSGTRRNLDRHARRMAGELFRMITF